MHFVGLFSFVLLGTAGPVRASGHPNGAPATCRDGVVLMAFQSGISDAQQRAVLRSIGAVHVRRLGVEVHLLRVRPGQVFDAIQSLKARPEVRYAEPDFVQTVEGGALPNDTSIGTQWATQNTGQTINGITGTPGADERSLAAWSVTTGTNSVVVAALDSGVQYSHPDLLTNMWTNPGGVGGCPAGTHGYSVPSTSCDPMDDDTTYGGHGTHVAGILGAVGNNALGVAGVNWTSSIMAVKWMYGNGAGYTSDLITAMDWVVTAKQAGVNVRIVNDSATSPGTAFSQALSDEIDLLGSNDILVVTAAGNTAQNNDTIPRYPCSYDRPNMICVAASDQNDNLWRSSNYGPVTVKLAAPGVNIYSTLRLSNDGYLSGTSMATPQVSGTAALILSLGYQSVSDLRSMILSNVDPLPSLTPYLATGGRLNVCKALPGCSSTSTGPPTNSAQPLVTGVSQYGSLLGASTGMWSGMPTNYSYQWYRCDGSGSTCSLITGATAQSYVLLASADVGAALGVAVTATNASGFWSVQSGASAPVAQASSPFGVSSTIQDGATLSGTVQWQAAPAQAVNFVQFYVDGVLSQTVAASPYLYNQGTTGMLDTTTLSNGAHVLGIRALAADNRTYGFCGATVGVMNVPANTTVPMISGTAVPGRTLVTSSGSWTNNPTGYAYQWNRCDGSGANCSAIQGATSSSYTVANADAGSTLRSAVTATNAAGSNTARSAPTAIVPGAPSITTSAVPNGAQNVGYSVTLTATGGTTPYTWSIVTGSLPVGLTLGAGTGVISGNPTGTGTSNFTVQVTDANSQIATKALSIAINPSGGGGGIALVQSNAAEGTGIGSLSVTFPANNTAGNVIIAFVRMSTTSQTVTVTDSAGNAYTDAVAQAQTTDGHQVHVFYAKNIVGAANTVSATFSATNNHPWVAIYEYSGLSATSPLDQTAHAQGSSSTPNSGATATTARANELVFAAMGLPVSYPGTATAGSGYTLQRQDTGTSRAANETAAVTSTGSYATTFTLSSRTNWSAVVATFSDVPSTTATSSTSTTTTTVPPATATTSSTATSTTIRPATLPPCTSARCALDAGLQSAACADETVPASVTNKFNQAANLIERAETSQARQARKLLERAKKALKRAKAKATRAAMGKKPKLTADCAAALRYAADRLAASLSGAPLPSVLLSARICSGRKESSRCLRQGGDRGVACSEDCRDDQAAPVGDLVAVSLRDPPDEMMRAEQAEEPDCGSAHRT
jgi:thermitase